MKSKLMSLRNRQRWAKEGRAYKPKSTWRRCEVCTKRLTKKAGTRKVCANCKEAQRVFRRYVSEMELRQLAEGYRPK